MFSLQIKRSLDLITIDTNVYCANALHSLMITTLNIEYNVP